MSTTLTTNATDLTLGNLSAQINDAHRLCVESANASLQHGKACGEMLNQAKDLCPHGEWAAWLENNFEGSSRTAQVYMRVAKRWPEIEAKAQTSALLSLDGAQKLLAESESKTTTQRRFLVDIPLESRRDMCTKWWDILASHTLLLDAAGWSIEKIAETLGMPQQCISLILDPQPPQHNFGEFFNKTGKHFYRNAVAEAIAFQIWHRYRIGALYQAPREGFTEVVPALEALKQRSERQYWRLHGSELALMRALGRGCRSSLDKETWPAAIWCCVTDDMRAALGIEISKEPSRPFVAKFAECVLRLEEDRKAALKGTLAANAELATEGVVA